MVVSATAKERLSQMISSLKSFIFEVLGGFVLLSMVGLANICVFHVKLMVMRMTMMLLMMTMMLLMMMIMIPLS